MNRSGILGPPRKNRNVFTVRSILIFVFVFVFCFVFCFWGACFVLICFCHSVFLGISSPGLIYIKKMIIILCISPFYKRGDKTKSKQWDPHLSESNTMHWTSCNTKWCHHQYHHIYSSIKSWYLQTLLYNYVCSIYAKILNQIAGVPHANLILKCRLYQVVNSENSRLNYLCMCNTCNM